MYCFEHNGSTSPLALTHNGDGRILVVMDYNDTKRAEACPLPNQQAETVLNVLVTEFVGR